MTALVIGLGNPDRGDDGLGPAVARRVSRIAEGAVDVVVCADPAALVDLWAAADLVVVVDAMTSGRDAGTVTVIDATVEALAVDGWAAGGSHALGLAGVVELARVLDRLPRRLHIVGIEVDRAVARDPGLSPDAIEAVGPAAEAVLRVLGLPGSA